MEEFIKMLINSNLKVVAKDTGIPYDRMYKWTKGVSKPKLADYTILNNYFSNGKTSISDNNSVEEKGKLVKVKFGDENVFVSQKALLGYIPVYDITFSLGFSPTFIDLMDSPDVLGYINFHELKGSTYVVRAKGHSMAPLINDGDFVGIRPVKNMNSIDFGNPYGIITEDLAVFKRVRTSINPENIRLLSDNKDHDEFEIPKIDVVHLFVVVGILSVKSITY